MTLNDYQQKAMTTCMPSSRNFSYMMLNLVGEVGEFASKIAKLIRKEKATIDINELQTCGDPFTSEEVKKMNQKELEEFAKETAYNMIIEQQLQDQELQKEAGDILWQLSGLCTVMHWNLEDIAQQNLDKLASRQQRNVIDGNGDNR